MFGFALRICSTASALYSPMVRRITCRNFSPGCTTTVSISALSFRGAVSPASESGSPAACTFRGEEAGTESDFAASKPGIEAMPFRMVDQASEDCSMDQSILPGERENSDPNRHAGRDTGGAERPPAKASLGLRLIRQHGGTRNHR